jgi:pyruvate formate lyase activating enzyme
MIEKRKISNGMNIFSTGWSEGFDGPGRRWVVYLKGCNFRCRWCANPEGLSPEPQILFYPDRAQYANQACPYGAVVKSANKWVLDRGKCAVCPDISCVRVWHHPAFEYAGKEVSVAEIVGLAEQYRPLFGRDGGVTFGGGEPMLQANQLLPTIKALRQKGIHTAIETNASTADFQKFVGLVDLLICDLKCISNDKHLHWMDADNRQVLQNLQVAAKSQSQLIVRIPFVKGMNDNKEEMEKIRMFLYDLAKQRKCLQVEVLRQHHLGEPKYAALGMEYPMRNAPLPERNEAQDFVDELIRCGFGASLGG